MLLPHHPPVPAVLLYYPACHSPSSLNQDHNTMTKPQNWAEAKLLNIQDPLALKVTSNERLVLTCSFLHLYKMFDPINFPIPATKWLSHLVILSENKHRKSSSSNWGLPFKIGGNLEVDASSEVGKTLELPPAENKPVIDTNVKMQVSRGLGGYLN